MNTKKYNKRTLIIILFSLFLGATTQAQTIPTNMQVAKAEMDWSEQEYTDYLKHTDNQEMIPTTRILVKHEFLGKPNIIRTKEVLDSNCIVKPWTIPMLPNYYIKEEKTNENNK